MFAERRIFRLAKKIVTVRDKYGNSYVGLEKNREGIQRLERNKILVAFHQYQILASKL